MPSRSPSGPPGRAVRWSFAFLREAVGSRPGADPPVILLDSGVEVATSVVIAATGMDWRRLDVEGVDELIDRGVYYGAGRSEAPQCSRESVAVVGAGNAAGQAALNLADARAKVTMIVRGDRLAKTMSAYLVARIEAHPLIDVRLGSQVTALRARGRTSRRGRHHRPGRQGGNAARHHPVHLHRRQAAQRMVRRRGSADQHRGLHLTGLDLLDDSGRRPAAWPLDRDPLPLETSRPGVFAAGDVRYGSTKRVAGAVGDGAMAVALAYRYLEPRATDN